MKTLAQFRLTASAVFVGALAALLVRDLIHVGVTYATAHAVMQELTSTMSNAEKGIRESAATAEALQRQARQQRIDSAKGKELARRCLEFQEAARANSSSYAAEQARLMCAQFEHYVQTGQLLRQQPSSQIFTVN